MVLEIQFNFQIDMQSLECAEKPFLKSLSIRDEILSKFRVRGTWVSKGDIQEFENSGVWVAW